MINRFAKELNEILKIDEKSVLILMGIGRFMFRESMENCPQRTFDIGVMEPMAVGMAAGMAAKGMIPFLYTWSPFLVERAYEQLKLDFGSQKLGGNFIGAGASYDLSAFGESHYCPADVPILKQIKNMQIVVPGTENEFATLFRAAYDNHYPTYYRLTAQTNDTSHEVVFGKANVLKKGDKATIIVVGPMLDYIYPIADQYDVTILYYTTVVPFDEETLKNNIAGNKVMICEPYNKGAILSDVLEALPGYRIQFEMLGFEKESKCGLGKYSENVLDWGWDQDTVKTKIEKLLEE